MKIEIKENTVNKSLILSDIPDRVFITDKLWVSTSYDVIKIGIEGGSVYLLEGVELVEIPRQRAD